MLSFFRRSVWPRSTTKLDDHHLSVIRENLFKIFAATFLIWRPFSASATRRCATPFLRGFTFQLLYKFARPKHNFFVFENCIASYIDAFSVTFALDSNGRKVCCNAYLNESPEKSLRKGIRTPLSDLY